VLPFSYRFSEPVVIAKATCTPDDTLELPFLNFKFDKESIGPFLVYMNAGSICIVILFIVALELGQDDYI
jgi:hypothetical protein